MRLLLEGQEEGRPPRVVTPCFLKFAVLTTGIIGWFFSGKPTRGSNMAKKPITPEQAEKNAKKIRHRGQGSSRKDTKVHVPTAPPQTDETRRKIADAQANRVEMQNAVLHLIAQGISIRKTAQAVGTTYETIRNWQVADVEFAKRMVVADAEGSEILFETAWDRAVKGVTEDVYYQGDVVGQVTRYSDQILLALLRAKRPEFEEKQHLHHSGPNGGPIPVVSSITRRIVDPGKSK